MTLTEFSMNAGDTAEEHSTSATVELFKQLALELIIAIVFGVVFRMGGKATNNAIMVDSEGNVKASYSKIHPYTFASEEMVFNGASEIRAVKLSLMTMGLTICYDLRFPEVYRALDNQCDLIINIANRPDKRVDHGNALLKARTIESKRFEVGVNRIFMDGMGYWYVKSWQVINPNG